MKLPFGNRSELSMLLNALGSYEFKSFGLHKARVANQWTARSMNLKQARSRLRAAWAPGGMGLSHQTLPVDGF